MSTEFAISTYELRQFAAAARSSAPAVNRQLRAGIRTAGGLVATAARKNADWSSKIPGSIRVSVAGVSARITAGGSRAPDAAPFEHKGQGGWFRHPVFGGTGTSRPDAPWVDQKARPFLSPALEEQADPAAEIIRGSVADGFWEVLG